MHHSYKTLLTLPLAVCLIPLLSSCASTPKLGRPVAILGIEVTPSTVLISPNDRSLVTVRVEKEVTFPPGITLKPEAGKDCNARIVYGNGEQDDTLVLKTGFTEVKKFIKETGTYSIVVSGDKSKGDNACAGEAKATLVVEEASADAMNDMGFKYTLGDGVPQSDAEAVNWYRKAAAKGHAMATYNLGFMYEYGRGVEQDIAKAFSLYQSAAKKGSYEAMRSLGQMYADGRGVSQSRITGYAWATLAEARATEKQDKIESLQLVDQIGKTLSSNEITSAKKASKKLSGTVAGYQAAQEKKVRMAAEQQATREEQARIAAEQQAEREAEAARKRAIVGIYDQGGGVLKDNRTGLEWTQNDNGGNINWSEARRYCLNLGGGWRLPGVSELQGLYDKSGVMSTGCGSFQGKSLTCKVSPLFNLTDAAFWSDTSAASWSISSLVLRGGTAGELLNGVSEMLLVSFHDGKEYHSPKSTDGGHGRVLCVRKEQARMAAVQQAGSGSARRLADMSFVDQGGGVLRNTQTGLEWTQHDNGSIINWDDAYRYCTNLGGGWRLPSVVELEAVCWTHEGRRANCKVSPLFRLTGDAFWSGDEDGSLKAWYVKRPDIGRFSGPKGGFYGLSAHTLCVRDSGSGAPSGARLSD